MAAQPTLDRREFTLKSALALLGGVTVTVAAGCGGGGSAATGPSPTTSSGTSTDMGASDIPGAISGNHGHAAVITAAQLASGNAIALTITGSADHPHRVELTAGDLARLANNQVVSKDSSTTSAHYHVVTFTRGGEQPGPGY